MIYYFNTSLECHSFNDGLLKTIATARKIKISFVFFKLILSEYDFFPLSFHSKVRVQRKYETTGPGDKQHQAVSLVDLLHRLLAQHPNLYLLQNLFKNTLSSQAW